MSEPASDELVEQIARIRLDEKCRRLVALVVSENGVSTEDERIEEFADDRAPNDDTINVCVQAGCIKQIGDNSSDNFSLVPGWWPYQTPREAARAVISSLPIREQTDSYHADAGTPAQVEKVTPPEAQWQPIETAPENQIVDVLFDPRDCDAEFYCPAGKITGLWRRCAVYRVGDKWYASDGLDAMQRTPIRGTTLTHWMAPPTTHSSLTADAPSLRVGASRELNLSDTIREQTERAAGQDDWMDKAMLAIAPELLGLSETGRGQLTKDGVDYLSADELKKLASIVTIVEREIILANERDQCPRLDVQTERVAALEAALRNLVMLERTPKDVDMCGKPRTYAHMQSGTILAEALDEARAALEGC